jgi:8-oxo-dGTP pyrophosphatase MutT (NUDIX family)
MTTLCDIERVLVGHEPVHLGCNSVTPAAVALILRQDPAGLQVLFIERAAHDNDPWSGNVGFPGGKIEKDDRSPQLAAERETLEEIGLDLRTAYYLGRLSDIAGAHLPVKISCFVYGTGHAGPFRLSEEVRDIFWVPLEELRDPARHVEAPVRFDGRTLIRPAIRLPQPGKPVLWGITYRLVMEFLDLLQRDGER